MNGITMTTTCAQVDVQRYELGDRRGDKRLNRRDTTIVVEGAVDRGYHQRPNVLYKKVAKQKYGPPKTKYGPPKAKYGPPPPNLAKKNKKHVNKTRIKPPKFRPQKGRYATVPKSSKRPLPKPVYGGPSKKHLYSSSTNSYSEPFVGFQAHNDYTSNRDFYKPGSKEFHDQNLNNYRHANFDDTPSANEGYGEPPVDSYGAPIKPNLHDLAISNYNPQQFPSFPNNNDLEAYGSKNYAQKPRPANLNLSKPATFDTSAPDNGDEEMALNSYSDIFNYRERKVNEPKKMSHQNVKFKNQWNGNHMKHADSEIIVGGQYAEPPARFVPKLDKPSAPVFMDDSEFAPLGQLSDTDVVASAMTSPYVNYKHSNMAFSPQNLNDAFSIIN